MEVRIQLTRIFLRDTGQEHRRSCSGHWSRCTSGAQIMVSQMAELHNRHARLQLLLPLILKLYLAPGADNNNQIMMVTRTYFPTCQALMLL